ncbi:MAG TPA: VOC family protein [Coxiellaceae bacterium]|nr:VOC family protein [Coxiellaceae bacterium]
MKTLGLRHVALFVKNLEECVKFYTEILNMEIEWQPDGDNYYLTSGVDNLALHRAKDGFNPMCDQRLDHIGFILETPESVDAWYKRFEENSVTLLNEPKTHRDGARSFYCKDPAGTAIQMIYHPSIV